jgi:DNA-binding GntR family transcriptional regulator
MGELGEDLVAAEFLSGQGGAESEPIIFKWSPTRSSRTRSLPEQIAELVGNQIVTGDLVPGERIREQDLAQHFDVSRGPVREALRILEKDGLIQMEPRRGVQVTRLSIQEVSDVFEIRAGLLGVAAKMTAERRDAETMEKLDRLIERVEAVAAKNSLNEYVASVQMLNLSMAEASGNRRLADMIFSLAHLTFRYSRLGLSSPERRRQSLANWKALAKAIRRGDPEEAKSISERLVHESRTTAVRLLLEQEQEAGSASQP